MSDYAKFDAKLDMILGKVDALDTKVDALDTKVTRLEDRMDGMEKRMDGMEKRMDKMDDSMERMGKDVSGIKLRIENELSRNIRIIAEGHLDLNRKLDEALKNSNERELFMIRLNYLEGDMKRIKEKVFTQG